METVLLDGEEYYVAILHSSQHRALVDMAARDRWKLEWRRQRLARKGIVLKELEGEIGEYNALKIWGSA